MKKLSSFVFLLGIFIFFSLFFFKKINFSESFSLVQNCNKQFLLLAFISLFPEILLKALRLKWLSHQSKHSLSVWHSTAIYLSGQPYAIVTPAKLGDAVRIWSLKKWAHLPTWQSLAVHIVDKIYDLVSLLFLAAISILTFWGSFQKSYLHITTLLSVVTGMLFMFLILKHSWLSFLLKKVVLKFTPPSIHHEIQKNSKQFYSHIEKLVSFSFSNVLSILFSFLAWWVAIFRVYICVRALNLDIPFVSFMLKLPIAIVVEFIPISILGFGTRESALLTLFSTPSVTPEAIISLSLLAVLVGPLFTLLLGLPFAIKMWESNREKK